MSQQFTKQVILTNIVLIIRSVILVTNSHSVKTCSVIMSIVLKI